MAEVNVFELAHRVPIVEVIRHYIRLEYRNGCHYGLCPFHNDKRIGSFVVFPNEFSNGRGWFQCYACGEKGDNIDFVSKMEGVSIREAAIFIAERANLISPEDACNLRIGYKNEIVVNNVVKKGVKPEPSVILSEKRSPEHLDKVYRCFGKAAKPLSEDVKKMLLTVRKIPESSLHKYFLYPTLRDFPVFWPKFRKELTSVFEVSESKGICKLLLGVPGFYLRTGKNQMTFSTSDEKKLGIMVFDREGRCSGIQTRALSTADGVVTSKDEKSGRYKFLSSGYANGVGKCIGKNGCSCGYVEDVLIPAERKWTKAIALTEGRFKAETLASLGFLVVNMHSISNWKSAGEVALDLAEKVNAKLFVLCYDREENQNVLQSASSLYGMLSKLKKTEFAVWDASYGKGIDDVVNAGHISRIRRVSADEYFGVKQAS